MAINRTRRAIGLSAFLILVAMGTGWALTKISSAPERPAVTEPARDDTRRPDIQPAATDPEYDRSDLLLMFG